MQITLIILLIIFFLLILFVLSTLKINIKEVLISTDKKTKKYNIDFCLYIFKIKYFKININNIKRKRSKYKSKLIERIFNVENSKGNLSAKRIIEIVKSIGIEKIKLYLEFGLEDVIATSFITAIISSLIGIILANKIQEYDNNIKYKVTPYYINKNFLNLKLNCIIFTKVAHIIHIIIKQKRRSEVKYGRTSNRKSNANSYG